MSNDAEDLVDEVARFAYEVIGRLSRLGAEEDLSLTQLRMLGILRGRRPRMAELAARLGTDRSSTTGLIGRAEQRGLVERTAASADGRGVHVGLTAAGDAFAERLTARATAELGALLVPLDEGDRAVLRRLLERVLDRPVD